MKEQERKGNGYYINFTLQGTGEPGSGGPPGSGVADYPIDAINYSQPLQLGGYHVEGPYIKNAYGEIMYINVNGEYPILPCPVSMINEPGFANRTDIMPEAQANAFMQACLTAGVPISLSNWRNTLHTVLDLAGMIPVVGEAFDGANAIMYAMEGDFLNAAISAGAVIPLIGQGLTGVRLTAKGLAHLDEVVDLSKNAEVVFDSYKRACNIGSPFCFTEDTIITVENGYKKIKDIKVGDEVISQNTDTGETGLKKVATVYVNETDMLVHIKACGEVIKATPAHAFWVIDAGWVKAKDLLSGDKLRLVSGKEILIESVYKETLKESINVYNFEVEEWHTYFVSGVGILVHNDCWKTIGTILGKAIVDRSTWNNWNKCTEGVMKYIDDNNWYVKGGSMTYQSGIKITKVYDKTTDEFIGEIHEMQPFFDPRTNSYPKNVVDPKHFQKWTGRYDYRGKPEMETTHWYD